MTDKEKKYINDILNVCADHIENNDWIKVYDYAGTTALESDIPTGIFTKFLLDNSINPLEYVNEVPYLFGEYLTLDSIIIPSHIKTITEESFSHCAIKDIKIEDGVETIDDKAFEYAAFKTIEIPESVTEIGRFAFADLKQRFNPRIYFDGPEGDFIHGVCHPQAFYGNWGIRNYDDQRRVLRNGVWVKFNDKK